jgi:hypothetical protein
MLASSLLNQRTCTFLLAVGTGEATLAVKQVLNCYCLMLTAAATGVMVTLLPLSGRIWYYEAGTDDKKMGFFLIRMIVI